MAKTAAEKCSFKTYLTSLGGFPISSRGIAAILFLCLFLILDVREAFSISEAEKTFLQMYFKDEELVVISATRSLKSITRVAENVEVVTKEDIELMNAHSVAEALYNVLGVQVAEFVGPGSEGLVMIHGSGFQRVAIFLDGVPLQTPSNTFPTGDLPVQMIEKIEVIKGPASSAWGSSFGGVVNIITKSVAPGDHAGGTGYLSVGERSTSDARAEIYGRRNNIGVYLYGGTLNSSGIVRNNAFWQNDLFSKVSLSSGAGATIDFSLFYHKGNKVDYDELPWGYDDYFAVTTENILGRVSLKTPLSDAVDLHASAWAQSARHFGYLNTVSTGERLFSSSNQFDKYGFSGNLTYRAGIHSLVVGADMLDGRFKGDDFPPGAHKQRKYAFYANDTISWKDFSVTPGLRYDHMNRGGEIMSPSIGVTYLASKNMLLKASVSRGFFEPALDSFLATNAIFIANPDLGPEKIVSYQVGAEANMWDAFRVKLVLFRHDVRDLIAEKSLDDPLQPDLHTMVNAGKMRTYGGEVGVRTKACHGFILEGGVSYEQQKNLNFSDQRQFDASNSYGINAAISYNDGKGLRAILKSHYLWWNLPSFWEAGYDGVIADFNIIKELIKKKEMTFDIFLTGHNIFNGKSFNNSFYPNPSRWLEAGVRCKF